MRLISLIIWAIFLSGAALGSCVTQVVDAEPVEEIEERKVSLPESCAHLYNVGRSREWQNCMGVGPK